MGALIQIGLFALLLAVGYFFGRRAESQHYTRIFEREDIFRDVVVLSVRFPPPGSLSLNTTLVCGNVVISVDYFKMVIAGLRNLVGGNITAYESLLDRARREAILRMQEQAASLGSRMIINMKFETSRVSGDAGRGIGSIEVLAYGTALVPPAP